MSPRPSVLAESGRLLVCACPCPAATLVRIFSTRETLPSTSDFDLKSATLDKFLSPHGAGSRPRGLASPVPQEPNRIFASFQGRISGMCRTSTRLGLKRGNGRRQSVFSFGIRKAALGLDCRYCLPE